MEPDELLAYLLVSIETSRLSEINLRFPPERTVGCQSYAEVHYDLIFLFSQMNANDATLLILHLENDEMLSQAEYEMVVCWVYEWEWSPVKTDNVNWQKEGF